MRYKPKKLTAVAHSITSSGAREQLVRHLQTERLGRLEIDD
jgi:hypothetical protein